MGGAMKTLACTAALWLGLAAGGSAAADGLDDMSWLAGHWRAEDGTSISEEGWFAPSGGLMVGVNRAVEDGAAVSFEYLRIEAGADGAAPVYVAQPGGGDPARFPLVEAGANYAVFADPSHDFPQMIRYQRAGDELTATISDLSGETAISWTWTLAP